MLFYLDIEYCVSWNGTHGLLHTTHSMLTQPIIGISTFPSGACFSAKTFMVRGWPNLSSPLCASRFLDSSEKAEKVEYVWVTFCFLKKPLLR